MRSADVWTEKHSPRGLDSFVGNPEAVDFAAKWAKAWADGKRQQPIMLFGQTGTGKTCLAHLLAKENGWQLFEINASDFRTKDMVEKLAGAASQNASFSGKPRLVLIDEVDGISGTKERGGVAAVAQVVKASQNPVILTANEFYGSKKLTPLRSHVKPLEFKKINYLSIAKRLREILASENTEFDPEAVKLLAKGSGGDFRGALLDLQALSTGEKITQEAVERLGYRERREKIFKVLGSIFHGTDIREIRRSKAASDVGNDLLKRWIEENIPRQYTEGEDIANAFERFSKADIYDGRIFRRQHYGFLRYSGDLMSAGVALSRKNNYGWSMYQFPTLLSKLSRSSSLRAMKKEIGLKVGKKTHSSAKDIISHDLEYLKIMMKDKNYATGFTAQFEFNDKEIAYLLNTKPTTQKVKKIIAEAETLRKEHLIEKRKKFGVFSVFSESETPGQEIQEAPPEDEEEQKQTEPEKTPSQTTLFGH